MKKKDLVRISNELVVVLMVRGRQVILDGDLARMYNLPKQALTGLVRKNPGRFPEELAFQLSQRETEELVRQTPTVLPFAFTEHGVVMLAGLLNDWRIINLSVQVIKVFNRLRDSLLECRDLCLLVDGGTQVKVVSRPVREAQEIFG